VQCCLEHQRASAQAKQVALLTEPAHGCPQRATRKAVNPGQPWTTPSGTRRGRYCAGTRRTRSVDEVRQWVVIGAQHHAYGSGSTGSMWLAPESWAERAWGRRSSHLARFLVPSPSGAQARQHFFINARGLMPSSQPRQNTRASETVTVRQTPAQCHCPELSARQPARVPLLELSVFAAVVCQPRCTPKTVRPSAAKQD
jgi:hypothetical protein